jgi:hypothetical protein
MRTSWWSLDGFGTMVRLREFSPFRPAFRPVADPAIGGAGWELAFANGAPVPVERGGATGATECMVRVFGWLSELGTAADVPAAVANLLGSKRNDS